MHMLQNFLKYIVYAGIFLVPAVVFNVSESMFFPFITGKNFIFRILVEIMLGAWLLLAVYKVEYRPRMSLILGVFGALLVSMFISDSLSPSPLKSFMSNFERMDGYVTLTHTFFYFIIVGTMMTTEKLWNRLFFTSLIFAQMLSVYGVMQALGEVGVSQGSSWRIDGTLGNSTYMAVYMLFNIGIAALLFVRSSENWVKIYTGISAIIFAGLLLQTGTRGAALGLIIGTGLGLLYVALKGAEYPRLRKISAGLLVSGVLLVLAFVVNKDSSFVQNTPQLERLTHISISEGGLRFNIWGVAWEGIKERPLLGWGHESFNYTFNTHYVPELYQAEEWYDRVHNIVLDWLISGGFVGATLYFGLLAVTAFYLVVYPHMRRYKHHSSHLQFAERAILFALLVAYSVHNFFVFDNVVSFIYFAILLGYIHFRVGGAHIVSVAEASTESWKNIWVPSVAVFTIIVIYMLNAPGIATAKGLLVTLRMQNVQERTLSFEEVLSKKSFGTQEAREQLFQFVGQAVNVEGVTQEDRTRLLDLAQKNIDAQDEEKPNDARLHVIAGGMYRQAGLPAQALEHYERAIELSPRKISILHEQALTYLMLGNTAAGLESFKRAYELLPSRSRTRMLYAYGAVYAGERELYAEIMNTEAIIQEASQQDFLFQPLYEKGWWNELEKLYILRIEAAPKNFEMRKNLASVYVQSGRISEAKEVLKKSIIELPFAEKEAQELLDVLK